MLARTFLKFFDNFRCTTHQKVCQVMHGSEMFRLQKIIVFIEVGVVVPEVTFQNLQMNESNKRDTAEKL